MKPTRSMGKRLGPLAVLLMCGAAASDGNAVNLECLQVINPPAPPLFGAKQPRSLVARMDANWVDALIAELVFMSTELENLETNQIGTITNFYPVNSTPVYHYTTAAAPSGSSVILSVGAAATPFGLANGDQCAADSDL